MRKHTFIPIDDTKIAVYVHAVNLSPRGNFGENPVPINSFFSFLANFLHDQFPFSLILHIQCQKFRDPLTRGSCN
jgi:hypothetical protein